MRIFTVISHSLLRLADRFNGSFIPDRSARHALGMTPTDYAVLQHPMVH